MEKQKPSLKDLSWYDEDQNPATHQIATDFTDDGSLRMAIRVRGLGAMVLRAVPDPVTGKMDFKGLSSFTNAEAGIWDDDYAIRKQESDARSVRRISREDDEG